MIVPVLYLGDNRYLTVQGAVVEGAKKSAEDIEFSRMLNPDYEPYETEGAPAPVARLTDANRSGWELAAQRGGYALDELLTTA
ncbi:hypothetical protein [Rhodococcus erythropolis]|uniref:hypothetical protein n=1 Tax=Rhodococcus erythropolis TaxID=1833 RepID=UPI000878225D|nr:hypothetical protein [Rhodococcus erythropolis]OFV78505.1 hypothetical protein RERY_10120 [Rhodococcus erythropolis]